MNAFKWIFGMLTFALVVLLAGCEGAPMAAVNEGSVSDSTASAAVLAEAPARELRETPAGEPTNAVRDEIINTTAEVEAVDVASEDAPTLILVNGTPSHVDFYVDGYGPYRVEGGGSEYLTISVGQHTIDSYDRNGEWGHVKSFVSVADWSGKCLPYCGSRFSKTMAK